MELILKMKAEKAGIEDNVYRLEQINSYNTDLDAQIKEAERSLARAKTDLDKETKDVFDLEFQALMLREIKLKVVSEQLEETGKTAGEQKLVLTQTREKVAAEDRAYQQKLLTFSQEYGSFSHDKLTKIHAAKESQVEARSKEIGRLKSEKEELELAVAKVEKMKLELTVVGDELNNSLEIKLKRLNGEMEALRRAVLKLIAERDELERTSDKSNSAGPSMPGPPSKKRLKVGVTVGTSSNQPAPPPVKPSPRRPGNLPKSSSDFIPASKLL